MKKRVPYREMVEQFARVLRTRGFQPDDAEDAAVIFAQNSLAGVLQSRIESFPQNCRISGYGRD